MEKEHLLGKTLEELQAVAEENGLPRFAAKQIASWLYGNGLYSRSRQGYFVCVVAGGLQDELQFLHDRKTGF